MENMINLINLKAQKYSDELFYADGEFFAIYDGKIAKLPDFSTEVSGIYKLLSSTQSFISTYIDQSGLDLAYIVEAISLYEGDIEIYENEIPSELDYDSFNFLYACLEAGISPYRAYKASILILGGAPSDIWVLTDSRGEYKPVLEYISEGCELIDFSLTDECDDEYWESIVQNIDRYLYRGTEVY